MKALLVVDLQNDFCPGGTLPAPEGDKVVPVINKLIDKFELVIASKDWHPEDSIHFNKWPKHCIKHTRGAEFHPDLKSEKIQFTFLKGTEGKDDGYSAFEATNENLKDYLKEKKVTDLYIAGLTTEYCVKETAIDAVKNNFRTTVVNDAIEGVREHEFDEQIALNEMKKTGVTLINSSIILSKKLIDYPLL